MRNDSLLVGVFGADGSLSSLLVEGKSFAAAGWDPDLILREIKSTLYR